MALIKSCLASIAASLPTGFIGAVDRSTHTNSLSATGSLVMSSDYDGFVVSNGVGSVSFSGSSMYYQKIYADGTYDNSRTEVTANTPVDLSDCVGAMLNSSQSGTITYTAS